MPLHYKLIEHQFGPGHTIEGALRLYNGLDLTLDTMNELVKAYHVENGSTHVPYLYDVVKIPVVQQTPVIKEVVEKIDEIKEIQKIMTHTDLKEIQNRPKSSINERQRRRELARKQNK